MKELIELEEKDLPGAVLVGLELSGSSRWEVEDCLDELGQLALTAGYEVRARVVARRGAPHPATYVGKGKASEIGEEAAKARAQTVIFDDDLSPSQVRNLQELWGRRVLDRTELILDIFAERARTSEARLQVEMARLKFLLPRLSGAWGHLNRQKGGALGTRDAGEKQIELDRRRARDRIHRLQDELKGVREQRIVQQARRRRGQGPVVALVGYTNTGKSTLLNALTQAGVFVEDKLFATLDPTTRAAQLPSGRNILFSDTVGFIRKLPPHLIEAFRATLEETTRADLLIEVLDASHKMIRERKAVVDGILADLGAGDKPRIAVLNKIDLVRDPFLVEELKRELGAPAAVSALTGEGLEGLLRKIDEVLADARRVCRLLIPQEAAGMIPLLHRRGTVLKSDYRDRDVYVEAILPGRWLTWVEKYRLPSVPE